MNDPPTPTLTSSFLTSVLTLSWTFIKNDPNGVPLGFLTSTTPGAPAPTVHYLGVQHGGPDGLWSKATTLPAGFGVLLLPQATATLLQGGTLQPDGRMLYAGVYYKVASYYDGANWTARVVDA